MDAEGGQGHLATSPSVVLSGQMQVSITHVQRSIVGMVIEITARKDTRYEENFYDRFTLLTPSDASIRTIVIQVHVIDPRKKMGTDTAGVRVAKNVTERSNDSR